MAYNLKDPEEVKEYLKNLHTEYKFGCYSEKNPEVCHLLGDFTEAIKKDFKKAAAIYKMNCDDYNYGRSCGKYGAFSVIGKGCQQDQAVAYKYMVKGCELNDPSACFHAGLMATNSKQEVTDKATAVDTGMKMLKKSCDEYKHPKACFYLSGIYLGALPNQVAKDYKEAYRLSLMCCENGNPYACANISQMHARGEGAQKNEELANTFKKRAEELYDQLKNAQATLKFQQGVDP
ncbi:hypothetical protein KM043_001288 [Ampulex compressa]|nr:hypothetical protein KM043_001288 [Ampulex compressa]